jgi:hypothetical protein
MVQAEVPPVLPAQQAPPVLRVQAEAQRGPQAYRATKVLQVHKV